jgi:hypothetical protein
MGVLVSVERARRKRALSRQSTDVVNDFLLAASTAWENACGRTFASGTRTEVLDGNGLDHVFLKHTPITSITSITIEDDDGSSHTMTVATDVLYDAATGRVNIGPDNTSDYDVFPLGKRNVTIVYVGGYGSTAIPDDVQEAVVLWAICLYAESSSYQNAAFTQESLGEHSAKRITSDDVERMMGQVNTILMRYMRDGVGS